MTANGTRDQYITVEARLASFKKSNKKRASGAGGRGAKALNWPHSSITPDSLAKAGFYYAPTPDHNDNVACFCCEKQLDGWEACDDPLEEHLKHTQGCGWAVFAAIEANLAGYATENPISHEMVKARADTFAGRWPHESKEGWTPKTEQLVEAGWSYTPSLETDDVVTCAYCGAGLDGWEPSDDPWDEHFNRKPDCPFFILSGQTNGKQIKSESQPHTKKPARGKEARASRVSRVSLSSLADNGSEVGSVDELNAQDDTVLTNTSTMTAGGKKSRTKKATTTKSRKTKAKKEETVETEDTAPLVEEQAPTEPPPSKPKRGKKRGSDAVEEPTLPLESAPAPKKRTRNARASKAVDNSVADVTDIDATEVPPPKKSTTGRKKNTKAIESSVLEPSNAEHLEDSILEAPPAKKTSARSKRAAKSVQSSVLEPSELEPSELEPRLPAKKATAGRKRAGKALADSSVIEDSVTEVPEAPAPNRKASSGKPARSSTTGTARKMSTASQMSNMSTMSMQSALEEFPENDEEIERQLELDLERPLTDDEDIMGDSDSERFKARKRLSANGTAAEPSNYAMFAPYSAEPNDEEVDDELKRLEEEMQVEPSVHEPEPQPEAIPEPALESQPETEQLKVPKKGRKAAPRKVSKQTKNKKSKAATMALTSPKDAVKSQAGPEPEIEVPADPMEMDEPQEQSMSSNGTVVHKMDATHIEEEDRSSRKVSFESVALDDEHDVMEDLDLVSQPADVKSPPVPPKKRGRPSKASLEASKSQGAVGDEKNQPAEIKPKKRGRPPKATIGAQDDQKTAQREPSEVAVAQPKKRGRPPKKSLERPEVLDESAAEASHDAKEEAPVVDTKAEVAQVPKRKPGRPSKAALAAQHAVSKPDTPEQAAVETQPPTKRAGRPPKKTAGTEESTIHDDALAKPATTTKVSKTAPKARVLADIRDELASPSVHAPSAPASPFVDALQEIQPEEDGQEIYEEPSSPVIPSRQQTPATPARTVTNTQSATQATISPSPSPQASDAENQPPSSRPSSEVKPETKRIALTSIHATPQQVSPSKRNIIAGLQSTVAWSAVDFDAIIGTPRLGSNKENGAERLIRKGKDLTTAERGMTVEEWVYYNASQAEKMLKEECEAMVSKFESEGTRAMNVLESLVTE